jgi:ADP-ribose pyrophosphatase
LEHAKKTEPIVLKARRAVFENSKFHVYADWITDGGNLQVKDYLVVAPRVTSGDLITGVTVLPIWNDRIVLLRTFRHAVGRETLEGARGFVDAHETPAEAAARELAEETGLVTTPDKLVPLGFCAPEASTLAARVALFAAPDCQMTGVRNDDEIGLGRQETLTLAEAETLVRNMQLEDVTTELCLHRYALWKTAR